jgi:hypothetical protein
MTKRVVVTCKALVEMMEYRVLKMLPPPTWEDFGDVFERETGHTELLNAARYALPILGRDCSSGSVAHDRLKKAVEASGLVD